MDKKLFLVLLAATSMYAERTREEFQKLGLSDGLPKILYILAGENGCVQKDLADMCKVRPSTLAVMLKINIVTCQYRV